MVREYPSYISKIKPIKVYITGIALGVLSRKKKIKWKILFGKGRFIFFGSIFLLSLYYIILGVLKR